MGVIFNTHNKCKVACLWVLILTPITSGSDTPHTLDMGVIFNTHNKHKVACLSVLILVPETIELPL